MWNQREKESRPRAESWGKTCRKEFPKEPENDEERLKENLRTVVASKPGDQKDRKEGQINTIKCLCPELCVCHPEGRPVQQPYSLDQRFPNYLGSRCPSF